MVLLDAVPPASSPSKPYDFDGLPERLQKVINRYVRTITELVPLISEQDWEKVVEGFSQDPNYHDTLEGKTHCEEILNSYGPIFDSHQAENLGHDIGNCAKDRWEELISAHSVRSGGDEIPNLREAMSGSSLLTEITNHRDEAEIVLSEEFGPVEVEDFCPFGFNFRNYRGSFFYVRESFKAQSQRRKEDESKTIRKFFHDPGYGYLTRDQLDPEIKKIIRLFDPAKAELLSHYYSGADQENRSYAYDAENVLRQLDLLDWKEYIEPDPNLSNVQQLCDILATTNGVEIWGEGGLGKTALAFEFIRRNLNGDTYTKGSIIGKQPIERFEKYVIITSKSTDQGERPINFKVERRGDPRNPSISIAEYNPGGRFETFIDRVSSLHPDPMRARGIEQAKAAMETLENRRILVVIDNFEDIVKDSDNHRKYTEFLQQIPHASKSKVIVTSRPPATGDTRLSQLQILHFTPTIIPDLLQERLEWLSRKFPDSHAIHPTILNFILDRNFSTLFETIINSLTPDFSKNMSSPSLLFALANLLGSRLASEQNITVGNSNRELPRIIEDIARSNELLEEIKDLDQWTVNHAWDCLAEDEVAKNVLIELYQKRTKQTSDKILELTFKQEGSALTRNMIEKALNKLKSHQLFLEVHDGKGGITQRSYQLTEKARRHLSTLQDFEELETEESDYSLTDRLSKEKQRLELLSGGIESRNRKDIQNALNMLVGKSMEEEITNKKDTKMDRRNKLDLANLNRANACRIALSDDTFSIMTDDSPNLSTLIEEFDKVVLNAISGVLQNPKKIDLPEDHPELGRLYTEAARNSTDPYWIKDNLEYASASIMNAINMSPSQAPDFLQHVPGVIFSQDTLPDGGNKQ